MIGDFYSLNSKLLSISEEAMQLVLKRFNEIDEVTEYNQQKMLYAFQKAKVSESFFAASTGYGYDDRGRDALDEVYKTFFDSEDALVRHNFVSGTHALTVALFGVLRPNDTMLCVTGAPYDTLRGVIGIDSDYSGSLKDFKINYEQIELDKDGKPDYDAIRDCISEKHKMIYIQRSRGYTLRPSLLNSEIRHIAEIAKEKSSNCIVMLDNCYGEFVEKESPISCGVDLMAGSLIKNPGGGIAPTGGYIVGNKDLVTKCSYRLTTPGTGKELGATLGINRELFMGTFHAPHVTGEALKTAVFAAALFELLGYEVSPRYDESRADIIEVLKLQNEQALIAFCKGIQSGAPVDSFVSPEPWDMPGYDSKVIMAAGAFTLGGSVELSADAPLREPYAAWMQGGLNFHSGKLGVLLAAQSMFNAGLLKI
ncbi:MAG: methionine gamma-lyase family protein [Bacillota bacterium]|nr:methionine gamma-lyase family protein [Bacillota bacterium]